MERIFTRHYSGTFNAPSQVPNTVCFEAMPHLHYVWFPRLRKERLVVDGKHGNQKLFQSLVQGNNEKGKKVMWDPHIKPFHANVNGKIEKQPIFV